MKRIHRFRHYMTKGVTPYASYLRQPPNVRSSLGDRGSYQPRRRNGSELERWILQRSRRSHRDRSSTRGQSRRQGTAEDQCRPRSDPPHSRSASLPLSDGLVDRLQSFRPSDRSHPDLRRGASHYGAVCPQSVRMRAQERAAVTAQESLTVSGPAGSLTGRTRAGARPLALPVTLEDGTAAFAFYSPLSRDAGEIRMSLPQWTRAGEHRATVVLPDGAQP